MNETGLYFQGFTYFNNMLTMNRESQGFNKIPNMNSVFTSNIFFKEMIYLFMWYSIVGAL